MFWSSLLALYSIMVAVRQSHGFSTTAKTSACEGPKLSGFLFDIDGTLVNSDPIHFAVFQELLLKIDGFNDNKPIDEEFFRQHIAGRQNAMIMADFFPSWPIPKREEWSIAKEARFREVAALSMMESKMNGLDQLKDWITSKSLPKAAVTNAPRLNAEAILNGIQYDQWFDELIIGDECEKAKPHPFPYLKACKLLNVEPQNCIVFEDSPSGAKAGKAAGAYVIGILSGQERQTLVDAGCNIIIENFRDPALWECLESLSIDQNVSETLPATAESSPITTSQ